MVIVVSAALAAGYGLFLPTAMAQTPPLVTSAAWLPWYESLLAERIAASPRERPITVYFSQAGDDELGDGSIVNPYRSLAKAREVLDDNLSGNIALLFRRGDVWREQVGISTYVSNLTIADYGQGAKPLFTAFQIIGDPEGWSPTPGYTNVYQRAEPEIVTWVKEDDDLDWPYSREFSISGVEMIEGSWFWDSTAGILYIHPKHGPGNTATDPRVDGKSYELVRPTEGPGIRVHGDRTRVENIRAQGWGLTVELGTHLHGIESGVSDSDQALFIGCESHYGLAHVMTHASSWGGIATFIDCEAGLTTFAANGGETMFNTYALWGGAQTIFHRCTATHGTLPSGNRDRTQRMGWGYYGHIGTGPTPMGLTIAYQFRTRDTRFGCASPGAFESLPPASTLSAVRGFVVDEVFEGGDTTGAGLQLGARNMARVNGRYLNMRPPPLPAEALAAWQSGGWVINCTIELDATRQPGNFGLYNAAFWSTSNPQFWHCAFDIKVNPGSQFRLDWDMPSQSPEAGLRNSTISVSGGGTFLANVGTVHSNAYHGVSPATVALDAAAITLPERPRHDVRPSCVSPLNCVAAPLPGGIVLAFDQTNQVQHRDAVGPVESYPCGNCDQSTAPPILNIDDFTCFVNLFAMQDEAANCDGSTIPPVLNIDDFMCFVNVFAAGCR